MPLSMTTYKLNITTKRKIEQSFWMLLFGYCLPSIMSNAIG